MGVISYAASVGTDKAVNREDKRSRRYRDRDLVFRDPTPPRTRARSLIANR
jgi:hypothetical protein